ncbi:MAG: Hsp20/alpha crystallin family protein [Verrucomicrobiota bacterium]
MEIKSNPKPMKMIRYNDPTNSYHDWDSFFADPFRAFAPLFRPRTTSAFRAPDHAVEWYEDDEHFFARVEMPGVNKKELNLDAEDGLVRLSFEKRTHSEGSESRERFERYLRTPEGADVSGTKAKLEDGILELTFPKTPESKPVSITVS